MPKDEHHQCLLRSTTSIILTALRYEPSQYDERAKRIAEYSDGTTSEMYVDTVPTYDEMMEEIRAFNGCDYP